MSDKKYLYIPNLPEDSEVLKRVVDEFLRAAFLTNSKLYLFFKNRQTAFNYMHLWRLDGQSIVDKNIFLYFENEVNFPALFNDADCYISGNSPQDYALLESADKLGKEILSSYQPNIFKNVFVSEEVQEKRAEIKEAVAQEIFSKYPLGEYDYILGQLAFGDTLTFFFWSKAYKEFFSRKKILFLCCSPILFEIIQNSPYVDKFLLIHNLMYRYVSTYFADNTNVKNLPYSLTPEPSKIWGVNYNQKFPYLINLEREGLNLPESVEYSRYNIEIPSPYKEEAHEIFHRLGLRQGRTIFFIINGNYFGDKLLRTHFDFWKILAERLKALDYDVVVNAEKNILEGCPSVYLGILRTSEFIGLCGNVVSISTGMVETICALNSKKNIKTQVIFPNEKDIYWRGNEFIWLRDCLPIMKYWGENFVDHRIEVMADYMQAFWAENINFQCHKWQDVEGADFFTIEKILKFILSD